MTKFSSTWKSSSKPRKQRLYRYNAPHHVTNKFLHAHLSDELAKKYGKRALQVRTGDRVKVMKGRFKGKSGKVEKVDRKNLKVFVTGLQLQKKEGTKLNYYVSVSNIMISELLLDDKKRQELLKRK